MKYLAWTEEKLFRSIEIEAESEQEAYEKTMALTDLELRRVLRQEFEVHFVANTENEMDMENYREVAS